MQDLVVVRHAETVSPGPEVPDAQRPLTPAGEQAADALGDWLAGKEVGIQIVIASPAVRARESTRRIVERLHLKWEEVGWVDEVYGGNGRRLWEIVQEVGEGAKGVLLVGHYPGVEDLVARLRGDEGPKMKFAQGGCAWLRSEGSQGIGAWRLVASR